MERPGRKERGKEKKKGERYRKRRGQEQESKVIKQGEGNWVGWRDREERRGVKRRKTRGKIQEKKKVRTTRGKSYKAGRREVGRMGRRGEKEIITEKKKVKGGDAKGR